MQLTPAAQQSAYQSCNLLDIIGLLIRASWLLLLLGLDVAIPGSSGPWCSSGFASAPQCWAGGLQSLGGCREQGGGCSRSGRVSWMGWGQRRMARGERHTPGCGLWSDPLCQLRAARWMRAVLIGLRAAREKVLLQQPLMETRLKRSLCRSFLKSLSKRTIFRLLA